MAIVARRESGGISWEVELERDAQLPGTLARGTLRLAVERRAEARGLLATLIATEHWQWDQQTTDSQGHSQTRTVTERDELRRVPVQLLPPVTLAAGERREIPFELPIPPLGPATLDATVTGVGWELELKLDVPGRPDSGITLPVRVLQPTALLRAGVVRVGQFALHPIAESETDDARAELELEPMPLCVGRPFEGRLVLEADRPMQLQEVRLEVRVRAQATVPSGRDEEITVWVGRLSGAGELAAGRQELSLGGNLPLRDLPTIALPHGRTDAQFHVILARAWARDPHLVRDVAICSTTEL
jgi:hypothetical protein